MRLPALSLHAHAPATRRRSTFTPRQITAALALAGIGALAPVQAATITDASVSLSNYASGATGVTATFAFTNASSIVAGGTGAQFRQMRFWMPTFNSWFNSVGSATNTCPATITIKVNGVAATPADLGVSICEGNAHFVRIAFANSGSGIPLGAQVEVEVSNVAVFATSSPYTMKLFDVSDDMGNSVDEASPMPTIINNAAPVASSVSISGNVVTGVQLSGSYNYSDTENDPEEGSTFRWMRNDVNSGIAGGSAVGTEQTYTAVSGDVGNYLYFCVTPRTTVGTLSGAEVCSAAAGPVLGGNEAPTASAVSVSGNTQVGVLLGGSYTYNDADNDLEGSSEVRWVRSATAGGVAGGINVATTVNYTPVQADAATYLYFCVTPVAATGASPGTEVCSDAAGPVAAAAINGVCGSAAGQHFALAPASNLCNPGTASAVTSAAGHYAWTCGGLHGGSPSGQCTASWANTGNSGNATITAPAPQDNGGWTLLSANVSATPPATPPTGTVFPQGIASFVLGAGPSGSDEATVTIQYTQPVPAGAVYLKYGPSPEGYQCNGAACDQDHWYTLPPERAVFAPDRLSVTLTLQDGGVGDADRAQNRSITDPGGPALLPAGATAIPAVSQWGMMLLSGLMGLAAFFGMRRRG